MTTQHFRTSSASGPNGGNCVEVALSHHQITVRHSKNPHGRTITFTPATWQKLLTDLLAGTPTTIVYPGLHHDVHMHHADATLTFTASEWAAFLIGAKNGEFNPPAETPENSPLASAPHGTHVHTKTPPGSGGAGRHHHNTSGNTPRERNRMEDVPRRIHPQ